MKNASFILMLSILIVAACADVARAVEVRLKVDTRETFVGSPIRIDVEVVNAAGTPSIEPPRVQDVQIIAQRGVSRSSQTFMNNGVFSREESVTYSYLATASRPGRFTIPPFVVKVDGQTLKTETIQFIAGRTTGDEGDALIVEVDGARDTLYVGEPLAVTLKVYIRPFTDRRLNVKLDEGNMWSLVDVNQCSWGAFIDGITDLYENRRRPSGREVLHTDSQGVERAYYLYEIKARSWPMTPGPLDLDETRIKMDYPLGLERNNSLFSMGNLRIKQARPLLVAARVAPIVVKPLPEAGRPAIFRGAVGQFVISATATPTEVAVGEPITVELVVRGTGRLETLAPPPLPDIRGLSDDFKVPNDPLAGIVDGNVKRFTQSIRARRDDVTQIPAIPFAYFDPRREEYVITRTDPIPIEVKAADVLSATQIVDATEKKNGSPTRSLRELQSGILANYSGTEALLSQGTFALNWLAGTLLAAPPILVLGVFVVQRRRRRLRGDLGFARRRSAKRRAIHALKTGGDATGIAAALTGYVADRCNLPPGGLTRGEVHEQLTRRSVNTAACERVDSVLSQCETLQFAGGGASSLAELAAAAEQCIGLLEREAIEQ